jgi:NADH dehydrogenase
MTQQVVLFGGTGFIGRHIVRRLARSGATIRIPTRDPEKALILKPMGDVGQIVPFVCSVHDDATVSQALAGADTAINLLGILYEKGRNTFQSVHVETAARLARLAREQGVKNFIHLSALGASVDSPSAYARSKAAGEQAVRTFFPDAVILRPSIVFGPEDNFFNMFAGLSRFAPALPLIGGGFTKFQPVYVGDIADAIMKILEMPEMHDKTYELGGPGVYSFRALLEMMLKQLGRKRCLVNVPWPVASLEAALLELLPRPMLTRDQVKLLKTDNIITDSKVNTLLSLGINPTALEVILPSYIGVRASFY